MKTKDISSRKSLSVFSLVMINVIAVDSLRTLPISAEYGFAVIFYYLLAAIIFFVPVALVAAELATAWPKTGGIYIWVREAFGKPAAFMTIWLQWIYNIVWYPTILAFLAGTIAYLINPALAHNKIFLLVSVLAMFWAATLVNCFGIRSSSWLSTIGALLGTLLPMLLIIILAGVWLWQKKPISIAMDTKHFLPSLHSANDLVLFVGLLFGLIGMEMSAVHAEDVKKPQRDYPRALTYSTIIIMTSLILGSLAIAIVVPQQKLSLVTGLIEAFDVFFKAFHLQWALPIIVLAIIVGGIGGVSTWVLGPTRGMLIACQDSSLPSFFSKTNRYNAPYGLLITQAVICSLLATIFLFFPSINSSYWLLTAMTSQLALLVYVMMFLAAIVLRYRYPDKAGSYRVPGRSMGMLLVAGIGLLTCLAAILLGFLPPSQFKTGSLFTYESILATGIIGFCILPFFIYRNRG